jgi:release factor glutamine methyltransferase
MPSVAMENPAEQAPAAVRPTLRAGLMDGSRFLSLAAIESARLDAEVLLRHVMGIDKAQFYLRIDESIEREVEFRFWELLRRRAGREPLAYITGRKEFWSLDFGVTPAVLIPRPETELMVDVVLERARQLASSRLKIVDLGTGCGVIAVCLARELPKAEISAVDISRAALEVARANAERHGVADRIRFLHGDLFAPLAEERESFDLIVANPPYVRSGDVATLEPEIRDWEPMAALDGGKDGLDFYRRIASHCRDYLTATGQVLLEIGDAMGESVAQIFATTARFEETALWRDYAGKDRVIAARKSSPAAVGVKGLDRG